ncbi:Iron/zinc purple acid phosphatase-like C-terminal domain [Dillenia turbinata]|uniref:Purple acid phosphatase n=1 Tax=Dillenia turbinata TaxID=194707 RepID=A0AAN8W0X8_9MAGN
METRRQFVLLAFVFMSTGNLILSHSYKRPPARKTLFVPLEENDEPEQISFWASIPSPICIIVHISMVGQDRMRISWITKDDITPIVKYGTSSGNYGSSATGTTSSYRFAFYKSGNIHDVVIGPLIPNTIYYYVCGPDSTKEFSFKTTPSQLPIKFAVIGDLGQTDWTVSTLNHVSASNYDMLLLPGDLSYADYVQSRWDNFGRLVEPLASSRPWMVTQGNHEIEKIPIVQKPFKAYNARWHMPFEESGSQSNLYYSFDTRVYQDQANKCGPTYITIGDGGNHEGLASNYDEPQAAISVFREASFGHGQLEVMNATHALWTWHRNQDDVAVAADSVWLTNLSFDPACKV